MVMTITLDLLALAIHVRLQHLKGSSSILSVGVDPSLGQGLEQMVAGFKFGWITEFNRCRRCFQKAPQNQSQTY